MKKHFYSYTNVSSIIDRVKPKIIMEIGCGAYENVMCLLTYLYKEGNDYHVVGITDNALELRIPTYMQERFLVIQGISYEVLSIYNAFMKATKEEFRKPVDIAILDSDHNYYTVSKELEALYPHLSPACVLIFHDTNNYEEAGLSQLKFENIHPVSNSTYQATGYADGFVYPKEKIMETLHLGIVDAIKEFVAKHPEFSISYTTKESCGVYVIERNCKTKGEKIA